jgi:hypothetical protein
MIAIRSLLLAAVLISSAPAFSAQSESSMLGYVGKSSFWLDVPTGWTADQQAAKNFGAVFVLVPPGTNFNSAAVIIIGSSYKGKTVADAIGQTKSGTLSKDPAAQIEERPSIEAGGAKMSLLEIRSKANRSQPFETIAFVALGQDVLVVTLSGLAEEPYNRGKGIFSTLLTTYKEAGIEVQKGP